MKNMEFCMKNMFEAMMSTHRKTIFAVVMGLPEFLFEKNGINGEKSWQLSELDRCALKEDAEGYEKELMRLRYIERANNLLDEASKGCTVEIAPGVYLESQKSIIDEQAVWDETDSCKELDFTTHPFWVTTDCGSAPTGINNEHDLLEIVNE